MTPLAVKDYRGTQREPRYAMCTCGAVLGYVPREHETSPRFLDALVKGSTPLSDTSTDAHAVRVLRRSQVREVVGDQTAFEALQHLVAHRVAMSN